MNKTKMLMVGLFTSFCTAALQGVIVQTAEAGIPCDLGECGFIKHYAPDDGLDSAIPIRCKFGDPSTTHGLAEGESSTKYCQDTDQLYVWHGEEIWCKYIVVATGMTYYKWEKVFDAEGWHKINDVWEDGLGCTKRAD